MDYPRYRREGFPLTSSLMESTVKQVSRRVKGSEQYWSSAGDEGMLRLRGNYLSDDDPMSEYWSSRSRDACGTRAYRAAGDTVTTIFTFRSAAVAALAATRPQSPSHP